jgi:hypothetical protein
MGRFLEFPISSTKDQEVGCFSGWQVWKAGGGDSTILC